MEFSFNWISFILVLASIVFIFRINMRKQDSEQDKQDERMFRPQPFKHSKPANNVAKSTLGRRSPSSRSTNRRTTQSSKHDTYCDNSPSGIFSGGDYGGGGGDCGGGGGGDCGGGGGGDCGGGD